MTKVIQNRAAPVSYDLHIPEQFPDFFADGFTQGMVGFPNSKLLFHTVRSAAEGNAPEERMAVMQLTIPTNALVELCEVILSAIIERQDSLIEGGTNYIEQFKTMLEGVTVPTPNRVVATGTSSH